MIDSLRTFAARWGDVASVAGLAISLVGFAITIVSVLRSKSAAESAAQAANAARNSLLFVSSIAQLASALAVMDEIKRLQRESAWRVIPDRYAALRAKLIAIRSEAEHISDEHNLALQDAIGQLADLEQKVERALSRNATPPNPAKFNEIVSSLLDKLQVVLSALQRQLRT